MAIEPIKAVKGTGVYVPGADIDTDRIIPARYLKCVTFDDLAEGLFYDVRFDPETGEPTNHPLDDERFKGASVLLSGINFGCGSSREHAPQSILRFGFKGIIAESFAEIFFGNSTGLGMPCVCASRADIEAMGAAVEADPSVQIDIDLENLKATCGDTSYDISMPESAREALLAGRWDSIAELLENDAKIDVVAEALPYV
ncbi:3-isopropylmalate dehydratase small subunit [Persicirhabdus sediminis]|uniref:3-isopropylmalate dehydratase n=1 Tax=Persicirhabdus sediminis TaxID=454144 RepID=A0A8J7MF32_9BACT|nr:3-isopropylmalate dehydratase small subunit [Persicirhabdus sediminis]MBK1792804.1 3-isopropylmalate dehydratase small subunit [Persicirhabdus sediminis]